MSDQKKIAVIAASPKPPGKAASDAFADLAAKTLRDGNTDVSVINARKALASHTEENAFQTMAEADALIIIFPLYVFCLPGLTMRFLQMYKAYADTHQAHPNPAVYAVVNCGFPEPEINEEAARVVGRFAHTIGGRYGFGVLIGSGGMVKVDVKPSRQMLQQYAAQMRRIKAEVATGRFGSGESVNLRINFPRRLYFFMGHMGWRKMIRKNGKRRKDLFAKPYRV